jgi:HEAT repeat protein
MAAKQIIRWTQWCLLLAVLGGNSANSWGADAVPQNEAELIAVLQSDAPAADKAITCKYLAVYGGKDAVAAIAPLLEDAELTSWARIPLEVIEDPAADEALRAALGKLEGRMLVGVINSIGVRRDREAVPGLIVRLQDPDAQVASAAAVSLGKIADDKATEALDSALTDAPEGVRSAVAEGLVLCAERLMHDGNGDAAAAIYDKVVAADVSRQRTREGLRGAMLARKEGGIPLLVEQLQSPDLARFTIAVQTAREMEHGGVTEALVGQLAQADADRRVLLIEAIAARGDESGLPALLALANGDVREAKIIALRVLRRIGNASCVETLLTHAAATDEEVAQAARESLEQLQGAEIDAELAKRLSGAKGAMREVLLTLVGSRRIDAVPAVIAALDDADSKIRQAALTALGETVGPDQFRVLVSRAVQPKNAADKDVARQALMAASVRMPDREACAEELVAAMKNAPQDAKLALLETLGSVGGTKALLALADATRSGDDELQDAASRLLGGWMTEDAGPVLMDLTEDLKSNKYRTRVLRGYIRIARQFTKDEAKKIDMCRKALAAADRDDERRLVMQVLDRVSNADALELMLTIAKSPTLATEAKNMALGMAGGIQGDAQRVQALMKAAGMEVAEVEIVKATYGAGDKTVDVTETVRKHAGSFGAVQLPSSSYNAVFGGDPAPGVVKQLVVQYKYGDASAEAKFAENAPIVLKKP